MPPAPLSFKNIQGCIMSNEDFKIHGAVRYKGRAYVSGQERQLLEAGLDVGKELERIRSRGALTGRERLTRPRNDRNAPQTVTVRRERNGGTEAEGEDQPLHEVRVQDLHGRLAQIDDADEVRRLARADKRSTARTLYESRLEELEESQG